MLFCQKDARIRIISYANVEASGKKSKGRPERKASVFAGSRRPQNGPPYLMKNNYSLKNILSFDTNTSAVIVNNVSTEIPSSMAISTYVLPIKRSRISSFNLCSAEKFSSCFSILRVDKVIRFDVCILDSLSHINPAAPVGLRRGSCGPRS